uniref:Uncharacterized protein n=1 Tax=Romanomermis culicivorax TaxID=13658 RepID=A0A915I5Y4_ROMCU
MVEIKTTIFWLFFELLERKWDFLKIWTIDDPQKEILKIWTIDDPQKIASYARPQSSVTSMISTLKCISPDYWTKIKVDRDDPKKFFSLITL